MGVRLGGAQPRPTIGAMVALAVIVGIGVLRLAARKLKRMVEPDK